MKTAFLYLAVAALLIACGGSGSGSDRPGDPNASSSSSSSSSSNSSSSSSGSANSAASLYGLYLSPGLGQADGLLGDAEQEQVLLDFIRDNGFNYLILYDLNRLAANSVEAGQLASLIARAKSQYGVRQVGAALGRQSGADVVVAYNEAHSEEERIDVLNVEYEFWNKPDRAAAFDHTLDILDAFQTAAIAHDLETEIYIGWITAEEAESLAHATDRILVHYYRQTDANIINYGLERLQYLADANNNVRIAPIFSSEGPENTNDIPFMGDWLETHPNEQAFRTWTSGYRALDAELQDDLDVMGAVWFIYDKFLDVNVGAPNHITAHPTDQIGCAGETVSFSVVSYASAPRYYWMKDGEYLGNDGNRSGTDTATLTVADIGNADVGDYYARVVSTDAGNPASFASNEASLSLDGGCAG